MMVHLADLNPVVELYEVLPVAGFPYPPLVQDPEPQIPQPLPEPQPQPEMMVHLADFNPVVELDEVLPVAGFPYPPLAYQRRSEGAFADVESLALFTAFHLNGNVTDIDTLRDMFPYILGLRDNVSLNTKLRNSRNSAALHLHEKYVVSF
ncbi:hypothetical protein MtrunA17_Chr5g0415361 [Medicago truncatula]|nr:hypothetical protein MtrunA17_Chr5g0415361 [Medicago truncatula]